MNCLNCGKEVDDNFCPSCGQKTSTKRYSLKHIFDTGILYGVFAINERFFHTLKTIFTRPGHGIREYIKGERIKYLNAFSFLLIIIAVVFFFDEYTDLKLSDVIYEDSKEFATSLEGFMKEYPRIIYVINIPLMAISTLLFFKRSKVNFAEHIILNTYATSALVILGLPLTLLAVFYTDISVLSTLFKLTPIFSLGYSLWFYYQFFSAYEYTKKALIFRSFFTVAFFSLIQGIVLAIISALANR